jgi:hypothetical protein
MLFYLVARIAPDERHGHLDALSGFLSNSATSSIVQRERSLLGLHASAPDGWFGRPMRAEHAAPLQMLSMGVMFDRLAKTAALRQRRARIRSLGGDPPPSDPTKSSDQPRRYSVMPRTLTCSAKAGHRVRTVASARQGVQSADQNR